MMQKNKIIFCKFIFITALQFCCDSSIMASQETSESGLAVAQVAAVEGIRVIQDVGSCYLLVRNFYSLGCNIKQLTNPTQERQYQVQRIQDQVKLVELRQQFMTCLVDNRISLKKGSLGIPAECEHAALLLGGAGGVKEAERMVQIFQTHIK